jgi:hypothetical protein
MRAPSCLAGLIVTAACLAACGLELGGLGDVPLDGGVGESHDAAGFPGESEDGSSAASEAGGDAPSQASGSCSNDASDCTVVPSGWTLVAFASSQGAACPSGFAAPTNLVEGPSAASACACGACSIGTQPTCTAGAITSSFDVHNILGSNTCGSPGTPPTLNNDPAGGCDTDLFTGNYAGLDLEYLAPAASGGQCASAGQATGNLSYVSQDGLCAPVVAQGAGCCVPSLAAPYGACVAQSGSVSCPAGTPFTEQHVVGTGVTLTCTDCGCNVTAECGGRVTLFTDTSCMEDEFDVGADGTCHPGPPGLATSFNSYRYVANIPANVACAATGSSSAANVTLVNEQTICCQP